MHSSQEPHMHPLAVCSSTLFDPHSLVLKQHMGHYHIWERPNTGETFEEYVIMAPKEVPIHQDLSLYDWRRSNTHNLVRALFVEEIEVIQGYRQLRVFTEHTVRLPSMSTKFELEKGIQVLVDCLKGFGHLFGIFGYLNVTPGMIGLDRSNNPRVWANINFARNKAIGFQPSNPHSKQKEMIMKVLEAVEVHIQPHPSLKRLVESIKEVENFPQAIEIAELFASALVSKEAQNLILTRKRSHDLAQNSGSTRKYFSKTPEHSTNKARTAQELSSFGQTRGGIAKPKPSILLFKEASESRKSCTKVRFSGNDQILQRNILPSTSPQRSLEKVTIKYPMTSASIHSPALSPRNCFRSAKSSTIKFWDDRKERSSAKDQWSNKELSFKSKGSSKKVLEVPLQANNKKYNFVETGSRTGKDPVRGRSPQPSSCQKTQHDNRFPSRELDCVAKSMAIIKKQLQQISKASNRDLTKQSTNDFEHESNPKVPESPFSRKNSQTMEFPNMKLVGKSIIHEGSRDKCSEKEEQNSEVIRQLRFSLFNRTDDIKKSEIIFEATEEQSINSTLSINRDLQQQPPLPKSLKKISNKKMTQSITLNPNPNTNPNHNTREEPPSQSSALARMARMRTQSRISNFLSIILKESPSMNETQQKQT